MTIVYLGEMTLDSVEFADVLRENDEHSVFFFTSAYQVHEWAENDSEIVVLYESQLANEAEELKGRFVTVERTPEMSDDDALGAVEQAILNLSTRKSVQ